MLCIQQRIFENNLFHSIMVDGKKKFLKKLWLTVIINVLIMITTVYDFINVLIIIQNVCLIFFEIKKKIVPIKDCFTSRMGYCQLVQINHSKTLSLYIELNCLQSLSERALLLLYDNSKSSFSILSNQHNSKATIHPRNPST